MRPVLAATARASTRATKTWIVCLSFLLAFVCPTVGRAEPLPPLPDRSAPLTPAGAPSWRLLATGRPGVDLNNFAISLDVGTSKLVVVWALKL